MEQKYVKKGKVNNGKLFLMMHLGKGEVMCGVLHLKKKKKKTLNNEDAERQR